MAEKETSTKWILFSGLTNKELTERELCYTEKKVKFYERVMKED